MRPAVADVPQFAHQASLGVSKCVAVDLVPRLPHHPQKRCRVQVLKRSICVLNWHSQVLPEHVESLSLVMVDELPRHERRKPTLERVHRAAYTVSVGYCHAFLSKKLLFERSAPPKFRRYRVVDRTSLSERAFRIRLGGFVPFPGIPRFSRPYCEFSEIGMFAPHRPGIR